MIRYVIDASVAIKWLVPENPEEQDVPQALALLDTLRNGGIALYQPAHWEAHYTQVSLPPLRGRVGVGGYPIHQPRSLRSCDST